MKLEDLLEAAMKGTYAGVKFDTETNRAIHRYLHDNKIPTSVRADRLHTTLLYSRRHLPNYKPAGKYDKPLIAKPLEFDVWKTRPPVGDEPSNCLILHISCPELEKRHKELMKQHDAQYDYDEYHPHITLSYNIGKLDVKKLPSFKDAVKEIKIVEEYGEDLDLTWAKNKGVKG